jgi:CheY-like chemotaxis protein
VPWHLHIAVRDTGIGIPVDRLARLFKSFSQVDASITRQYGGTGLGLAISKHLVELMGGKLWVESVPQKGSTFHFTLPLRAAPKTEVAEMPKTDQELAGLKVLVVDDNATNCRILTLQTKRWGMMPTSIQTATEALKALRTGQKFDLVILDMQMPAMDGLTLAAEIRRLPGGAGLPLVLLTSMGVRRDKPEIAALSFASCLTKPVKPSVLHEVLIRVVSGVKSTPAKVAGNPKLDPKLAQRLPLRVLLCDDNAVNQKVAQRLLQQMGYRADLAANGVEALAALDTQSYDLVFMDVLMPELGGLEATRIIRERQKQRSEFPNYKTPIIIVAMTANAMPGDREKCMSAGMDDYLAKPVRPEDVRGIVERWGPTAARGETQLKPATPGTDPASAAHSSPAAPVEDSPVDMARLLEFTDGTPENLRELVTLYLEQSSEQLEQLRAAVKAENAGEVRRLAHSCAGASGTCGVRALAALLRQLEHQAMAQNLADAKERVRQILAEFDKVRVFLEARIAIQSELASKQ